MKLPIFCIQRPVFATVLSLILILIGIMGYQNLETRFLPRFEAHRVMISTAYTGASASLVETSITTPLEKAISGIDGIDYISSVSNQGYSSIKVILEPGVNIYNVTSKIRNQIAMAATALPNTIQPPLVQAGYNTMDLMDVGFTIQGVSQQAKLSLRDGGFSRGRIAILPLECKREFTSRAASITGRSSHAVRNSCIQGDSLNNLRDYLDRFVINRIQQQPGIAAVNVLGANKYAIRITLHPNQMTARQINVSEIEQAIQDNNLELPAGAIKTPTMEFPITAKTALHTAQQFGDIVVKNNHGQLIYLKDIATVKLGNDMSSQSFVHINGTPGILLSIYNADDANPIVASTQLRALLKRIGAQLPSNMHYKITFDQSTFMKASISEVYRSIALSIALVAMILFFSLGKCRSSFIPIVTIPICLLATLGFIYFAGFSINIITLLAIVLSIGLVVDDAIVVLENIHRHLEKGLSRIDAAIQGSQEIAAPVIAMTLTLAAVYAPIGLIKGVVAHIFASFAFTLAIAVIISGFIALTLSPMMCSKFLSPNTASQSSFMHHIEKFFRALTDRYQQLLYRVLQHRFKIAAITVLLTIGGFILASTLQKTFLPKEDMGFLVTLLKSSTGTNNQYAQNQLQQLNQLLSQHTDIDTNVTMSFEQASVDSNNLLFSTLKPYQKRKKTANQLAAIMNARYQEIPGLNAISFAPSFGGSTQNDIAFYIMAPANYQYLYHASRTLIKKLKDYPGLLNLTSNIQFDNQQYNLTVNRTLANHLQVDIRTIDNTIADLLGGTSVSTFNLNGQTYDVDMQARKFYLQNVQSMAQLTVPTATGQFIPLSTLITVTPVPMQTDLFHYNRLRAAEISAEIAPGYTLGAVVDHLQKILPTILPAEVKYAFTGQARRIVKSANSMTTIFLLSCLFIYFVLSAQFESFIDPFIILLAVPLSIVGALVSLKMINGSINLYTMIGLITLVGLIAKHGILITQFANTLKKEGKNTQDALIMAASIRLRPILMTTAAMVCGALPLIFASGASAISREQIGVVFVGGLCCGTFFSLILVPISYSYFNQLKNFIAKRSRAHE